MTMDGARPVRAHRGTELHAKGWPQEAALRMLQNNLDPEVAEHPDELVVYGGTGRAARDWRSFDRVAAGEPIAFRADGLPLTAPEDGYVVFPNPGTPPGREWFYFARPGRRLLR